eukprot:3745365-Alexandrium_andersonii.AAC.1
MRGSVDMLAMQGLSRRGLQAARRKGRSRRSLRWPKIRHAALILNSDGNANPERGPLNLNVCLDCVCLSLHTCPQPCA